MMMNDRGQVFFVSLMLAVCFLILALAFAPVIKQFTDSARNSTTETQVGLDCGNTSISNFDKANCLFVDSFNPYFVGFLILFAGAIIVAKIYGGA